MQRLHAQERLPLEARHPMMGRPSEDKGNTISSVLRSLESQISELDDACNMEKQRIVEAVPNQDTPNSGCHSALWSEPSNEWGEGNRLDCEKLAALLKDLQEERTLVKDMLDNVRQEKVEVIAAMHSFQMEKSNAMQEMEDFRQAAQDEFVCLRTDPSIEGREKTSSKTALFPQLQPVQCRGPQPLSRVPTQQKTVQVAQPMPVQYAVTLGSAPHLSLQASLSSGVTVGTLSPTVPSRWLGNEVRSPPLRRFGSADLLNPKLTPTVMSPYAVAVRPAIDSLRNPAK